MKKILTVIFLLQIILLLSCATDAEDKEWSAAEVCPETGTNAYGMPNRGTFTDERDGQVYRYTTIGDQVWMAQNLNYEGAGSSCLYKDDNCATSGQSYYSCSAECPTGWHLPSRDEWKLMLDNMDSLEYRAGKVKSKDGWLPLNPGENANGTDDCGLDIKPFNLDSKYDGYRVTYLTSTTAQENVTLYGSSVIFFSEEVGFAIRGEMCRFMHGYVRCVKD